MYLLFVNLKENNTRSITNLEIGRQEIQSVTKVELFIYADPTDFVLDLPSEEIKKCKML